jgi:hypothetical protein
MYGFSEEEDISYFYNPSDFTLNFDEQFLPDDPNDTPIGLPELPPDYYDDSDEEDAVSEYNLVPEGRGVHEAWWEMNSDDDYQNDNDEYVSETEEGGFEEDQEFFFDEHFESTSELDIGPIEEEARDSVHEFILEHRDLFAWTPQDLGKTSLVMHKIFTAEAPPVKQKAYRTSPMEKDFLENEIADMLAGDIIRPSSSPWSSPVVLVKQKDKIRFCIDYRKLNTVTKKDNYPLPIINDLLDTLKNSSWYTSLDLASGYWQIEVDPKD